MNKERRPSKKNSLKENKRFPYRKQGGKRMKEQKTNWWMVSTIILGIIFIGLLTINHLQNRTVNLNGLEIKKSDWESMKSVSQNHILVINEMEDNKWFLCDPLSEVCGEIESPTKKNG